MPGCQRQAKCVIRRAPVSWKIQGFSQYEQTQLANSSSHRLALHCLAILKSSVRRCNVSSFLRVRIVEINASRSSIVLLRSGEIAFSREARFRCTRYVFYETILDKNGRPLVWCWGAAHGCVAPECGYPITAFIGFSGSN